MLDIDKTVKVITIDGPGGAGKGVIREKLARELNWHQLDSGILYRSLALYYTWYHNQHMPLESVVDLQTRGRLQDSQCIQAASAATADYVNKVSLSVEDLKIAAGSIAALVSKINLSLRLKDMYLEDLSGYYRNVTLELRSEYCANLASKIAVFPEVRLALLERQRNFLQPPGLVADGRDLGTVVFPDAELKIFLDADPKIRSLRREIQLKEHGVDGKLYNRTGVLQERDLRDKQRELAPLKPANDALCIDTTNMTIEEVFNIIMKQVNLIILR